MNHAVLAIVDGHISANELYTLGEIKHRLGLGVHAMRTARRQGLRILRIGRSDFVLGRDLIEYAQNSSDGASDHGEASGIRRYVQERSIVPPDGETRNAAS